MLKIFKNIKKVQISILIQLKIEKINLRSYLHKIERAKIKKYDCDEIKNIQHVLLQCFLWNEFKNEIFDK